MRSIVKLISFIIIFLFISYIAGCEVPYITKKVHEDIHIGMPINEIIAIATSHQKKPDSCAWKIDDEERVLFSNRGICNIPSAISFSTASSKPVTLTILFMGPGYLHNDFKIMLSSDGKALQLTEPESRD